MRVDEATFASEEQLRRWCDRIGGEGLRSTASAAHERVIAWVEAELARIPGLAVRIDEFEVLRWEPVPVGRLDLAGSVEIDGVAVAVAGAVPYTSGDSSGPLVHLAAGEPITAENAAGCVVLRDFPDLAIPYDLFFTLGTHVTPDCDGLRGGSFDRPGLADGILQEDLLAAARAGAVGLLITFDLPREQVLGYFEPHKGTHHHLPAVYLGVDEREVLRRAVGREVRVAVAAEIGPATTRNVIATLPGRSAERAILITHTDGNTWVQENGIAALLAIAQHLAAQPADQRSRTVELAFNTAHLHISKEGTERYARQLDDEYDDGSIAYAFAVEHLGVRELVPAARVDGPGRELVFSGDAELLLWSVGPSELLQQAVLDAIADRGVERVLVNRGLGAAVEGQVPRIASFGGLGSLTHTHLIPTTSIITGPWSLWAPSFGADAIDVAMLRKQALAVADIVVALDPLPREEIAGEYPADRAARAAGAPTALEAMPPEVASR